jgi:hypothetical protein
MTEHRPARTYQPGDWFGIFGERALVLLPGTEKTRVTELWQLVDDGADFEVLLDALIAPGLRSLPGFVLVSVGDEPTRVVARGEARATFTSAEGDVAELYGASATTWVERSLPGVSSMCLQLGPGGEGADYPIDDGLVRVGRVDQPPRVPEPVAPAPAAPQAEEPVAMAAAGPVVEEPHVPTDQAPAEPVAPAGDDAESAAEAEPEPEPAGPEEPAALDDTGDQEPWFPFGDQATPAAAAPPAAAAAPHEPEFDADHDGHTVAGTWDPAKVANHQPGIPGQPQAPSVTAVPVARLVFSSGDSVDVDRAILIGRAPEARRFTSTEQPRLVTVPSPNQEISSTHLEVRPGSGADHGSAVVTDMGSTNGTVLALPGLAPEDLQPGIAVQLIPGSVIDLGDGVTIKVTNP